MVDPKIVSEQLKRIGFIPRSFNKAEALELPFVLLEEEEIFECVSGWYEGGFALLCATNVRIILIDKKPFRYLTVEDLRFDMVNQIDYNHSFLDARIVISTGVKSLKFRSYNQDRLRKLIGHVQHQMSLFKKQQDIHNQHQQQQLMQIDQQLQTYFNYSNLPKNRPLIEQEEFKIPEEKVEVEEVYFTENIDDLRKAGLQEILGKFVKPKSGNTATNKLDRETLNIVFSKLPELFNYRQNRRRRNIAKKA